eukprot:TRINITY_DN3240_c0_g1_i1.p1 TRINITY_DN3240_c0_g1~~TRINITY_DN3240_c0_g1_i1.p1  ORF type:complete len:185 (+),score=27.59 TRINITY_DN3240_c0_g1_i1:50-604(+)
MKVHLGTVDQNRDVAYVKSYHLCNTQEQEARRMVLSPNSVKYDMLQYLFEKENKVLDTSTYQRGELTERFRKIMVDWLIKVHHSLSLESQSLYLTIQTMDRYVATVCVSKDVFQLIGMSSLLLSSKYEDIYPPEIEDFLRLTNDLFTREQILKMEYVVLSAIKFDLSYPTPLEFFNFFYTIVSK